MTLKQSLGDNMGIITENLWFRSWINLTKISFKIKNKQDTILPPKQAYLSLLPQILSSLKIVGTPIWKWLHFQIKSLWFKLNSNSLLLQVVPAILTKNGVALEVLHFIKLLTHFPLNFDSNENVSFHFKSLFFKGNLILHISLGKEKLLLKQTSKVILSNLGDKFLLMQHFRVGIL